MTVLEVIQRSTEFLTRKGVDSPRLQAELLLAHALKLPRMQLYLNFERTLSSAETDAMRDLVQRRGQREPLQYIVGSTSFCGLEIRVNRSVLIPRPETELLAEQGWAFLQELSGDATPTPSPVSALDFGTGSGCLTITLAVKCPSAQIYALDLSPAALDLARENAATHSVSQRVTFVHGDGFAALPHQLRFDLIVANPPYIPSHELPSLQPEVRDFEPHAALDGGPDGLAFFRRMALEAHPFLKPHAKLMLEIGDDQSGAVRALFEQQNWIVEKIVPDYTERFRIVIARPPA